MCSTTPSNDLGLTDSHHACTCGGGSHDQAAAPVTADRIREHYLVEGMTCNHCVSSVIDELTAVDGVDSVSVDLNAGGTSRVMVVSVAPIPLDSIRTALTAAGYELANPVQ